MESTHSILPKVKKPEYTLRNRIRKGNEYTYVLQNNADKTVNVYDRKFVLQHLLKSPNSVYGLKLTSDRRIILIDSFEKQEGINQGRIRVMELRVGHILNEDLYVRNSSSILVKKGTICLAKDVAKISSHYKPYDLICVCETDTVKDRLQVDTEFVNRLAEFYVSKMYNSPYLHLQYFADIWINLKGFSSKVKLADYVYKGYLRKFIDVNYLSKDRNLMYILYILYGHHMYTFEHSVDVAIYACMYYIYLCVTRGEKIDSEYVEDLFLAGLMHDFGKLREPSTFWDKKGRYDEEEDLRKKMHPRFSYMLCKQLCDCTTDIFRTYNTNKKRRNRILNGVYMHHKAYSKDYKGNQSYPIEIETVQSDLSKEGAEFCAILSIADSFDGIISPRLYHSSLRSCYDTCVILQEDANAGKLSKDLVSSLINFLNLDCKVFKDIYEDKIKNIRFDKTIFSDYKDITKV